MGEVKATKEELFRSSLADLLVIIEKVGPHCKSVAELAGMLTLAAENDGQLSLLMTLVLGKPK